MNISDFVQTTKLGHKKDFIFAASQSVLKKTNYLNVYEYLKTPVCERVEWLEADKIYQDGINYVAFIFNR